MEEWKTHRIKGQASEENELSMMTSNFKEDIELTPRMRQLQVRHLKLGGLWGRKRLRIILISYLMQYSLLVLHG